MLRVTKNSLIPIGFSTMKHVAMYVHVLITTLYEPWHNYYQIIDI